VAGEVALEEAGRVAAALALADSAGDVVAGAWVVLAPVEDDGVECPVELAVTSAAEPVACGEAARGGERRDPGESGEGGFG
jgi:hypothetical protein